MLHSPMLVNPEPQLAVVPPLIGAELVKALTTLYYKLTGKSGRTPDPQNDNGWIIVLAIILWILVTVFLGWSQSRLLFTLRVLGLMFLICTAPIASVELFSAHRVVRVVVETLIVIASVSLFLWAEFSPQPIGTWILYTSAIVIVLEVGSHLVEWNKDESIKRLSGWSEHWEFLKGDTVVVNRIFRRQQFTYLSIPFGFLLGLHVGLAFGYTNARIVATCLIAILFLASLCLTYFLINSFIKMIAPIFTTQAVGAAVVTAIAPANKIKAILGGLQLEIVVPKDEEAEHQNRDLELSQGATILRKIYLFDSLHNVLLLGACLGVLLSFFNVSPTKTQLTIGLLVSTFIFCQLPFSIGQIRLHRKVLWRLKGSKEVEFSEKLVKVAPRFPAFQLLTSLATTGTGSFLYFLLEEVIKNRLKVVAGS